MVDYHNKSNWKYNVLKRMAYPVGRLEFLIPPKITGTTECHKVAYRLGSHWVHGFVRTFV